MSKETKFLSIAIGLLQGINRDENISDPVVDAMDADRLYKFTQLVNEKYVDPIINMIENIVNNYISFWNTS